MTSKNTPQISAQHFLKTLTVLHLAFTVMSFIFSIVILFVLNSYSIFNFENIEFIYYLLPLIALIVVYASSIVFKSLVTNIDRNSSLKEKLVKYQTACIVKYALLEGPAILCMVTALITEHLIFICIAWAIIAYLYSQKPSKETIIKDLALNMTERNELNA